LLLSLLTAAHALNWWVQVRWMQAPASPSLMMHRSEHSLCLAWQAVIVAADTGPAPSKSVSEVTPAKTTDETIDCRVNTAIGRLNISFSTYAFMPSRRTIAPAP
jgi:hypothetical protein